MREVELPRDADGEEAVDSLFRQDGHWVEPPRPWGNPHAEAELSQLRRVLDDCADRAICENCARFNQQLQEMRRLFRVETGADEAVAPGLTPEARRRIETEMQKKLGP